MSVKAYSITDIGRQRQMNQDYVFTSEVPVGALPNLFMVADGMGGYKAGEFASKNTIDTIINEVMRSNEKSPIKILQNAIQCANLRIRTKSTSDENFRGMGTTLVLGYFDGKQLCVANVGDSRLYVIGDEMRQITTDHSLVEEMIRMGGLERSKARLHPDKNIITRVIGVANQVDVDFFEVDDVRDGDLVLLCSDGLTNMLEDSEIEEIVRGEGSISTRANRLVEAANRNGGKDNIAVVLVQLVFDGE